MMVHYKIYFKIGQSILVMFCFIASKLDLVHVVIFTDGEDNCSREYNLNSVLDLSKDKIKGSRMQLSFIQAGPYSEASRAIDGMGQSNFNMYNVADSADGIKFVSNCQFGKLLHEK
jgi:hypothetical protein